MLTRKRIIGWLLFSGKKHDDFPEADELIAIVYDGCYTGLQSHTFVFESDKLED